MKLKELSEKIKKLMRDKQNRDKEIIGDIKPGHKLALVREYSSYFIALYDERETENKE